VGVLGGGSAKIKKGIGVERAREKNPNPPDEKKQGTENFTKKGKGLQIKTGVTKREKTFPGGLMGGIPCLRKLENPHNLNLGCCLMPDAKSSE